MCIHILSIKLFGLYNYNLQKKMNYFQKYTILITGVTCEDALIKADDILKNKVIPRNKEFKNFLKEKNIKLEKPACLNYEFKQKINLI